MMPNLAKALFALAIALLLGSAPALAAAGGNGNSNGNGNGNSSGNGQSDSGGNGNNGNGNGGDNGNNGNGNGGGNGNGNNGNGNGNAVGSDAIVAVPDDQEIVQNAVRAKAALSLTEITAVVGRDTDGRILDVQLVTFKGIYLYDVTVLERDGVLHKLYYNARSGARVRTN